MFLKTLTIFDWDDTLYPTISYMMNLGINYNDLDHKIYSLLSVILDYSNIIIVSDAEKKWIINCIKDLQYTKQLINEKQIKILSSRDVIKEYENMYQKDLELTNRKIKIFKCILLLYPEYNNIISIGDSIKEYIALIDLYKNNKETRYFKNVKLFKHPNNDLLNEELKLLKDNYFDIYKLQENKDLIIKIDKQIFL